MRIFSVSIAVLSLGFAVILPRSGPALAASAHHRVAVPFAPVVVEWFSTTHPRVDQREVVFARLLNNNKPVRGARLSATVRINKAVIARMTGGTTNHKGMAQATFKVPAAARGRLVTVTVSFRYRGHTYIGRNDLKVRS